MWQVLSGVYLGWALGANDAANVFGTAVASRMLRFRTAAFLASVFVICGALLEGSAGMETYSRLTGSTSSLNTAFLVSMSAALTVTVMTWLQVPVSTSQAVVGSLVAMGVTSGGVNLGVLGKVVSCWVGTPIGAMLAAILIYFSLGAMLNRLNLNMFQLDRYLRIGLVAAGSYGAFALGANNVANVTGAFVGEGMLTPWEACIIGSFSIALGVATFSRGVMITVGRGLVRLDAFSALTVVLAEAVTVHLYAMVGVPVSTSQAVVGAVLGVGVIKGVRTVNKTTLWNIGLAWVMTPAISFAITYGVLFIGG